MLQDIINQDAVEVAQSNISWEKLVNKTVLITGANGYVPAYFVHSLLKRNEIFNANIKILALCRNEERGKDRFNDYLDRKDFKLLIQDVCKPIICNEKIDYIIHGASPAGNKIANENPVDTFKANVLGCENVFSLAIKNMPCEVMILSSVDVYGNLQSERFSEQEIGILDIYNPRNVYAISKRSSEALCVYYSQQYGVNFKVARPVQIMGPGIDLNDGRLHIDFISQILTNKRILLKSDGLAKRSFIYITDAIIAMMIILLDGENANAYNVACVDNEATVLQLAQLMSSLSEYSCDSVELDITKRNDAEVVNAISVVTVCDDKIKKLGFSAKYNLPKAAKRMMKYYKV